MSGSFIEVLGYVSNYYSDVTLRCRSTFESFGNSETIAGSQY
jgi:hypothetical protein